jgi:hypothetical protein
MGWSVLALSYGSGDVAVWVDGQLANPRVGNTPMRPIDTVFAAGARRESATSQSSKDRAEVVARLCQAIRPRT